MSDLSPKSRGLLDAARSARPSPAARRRMSAALAARIGVAAISAPPQPGPAAPPPAPAPPVVAPPIVPAPIASITAAMSTAKAIVVGTALSVTSVGAALVWPDRPQPPAAAMHSAAEPSSSAARAATSAAPKAPSIEPTPPAAIPEVAPPPSPEAPPAIEFLELTPDRARPPRAVAPVKASPAPPRESADPHLDRRAPALKEEPPAVPLGAISLGEETASLAEAQRSLKQGDGARAVALLDALAARHPTGVLREERLAANVFALCAAGRIDAARAAGQRFLAEMPTSVQADRVRASCAFASAKSR